MKKGMEKMLENYKSHIAFCVHDSLVLDVSKEDKDLLQNIMETFKSTDLGEFMTNTMIGKNYGAMRSL